MTGPNDKIILDGEKERQGDFVFTALEVGEYRFCFNNQMSTFAEKFVDFEAGDVSTQIFRVRPDIANAAGCACERRIGAPCRLFLAVNIDWI